MKTHKNASVLLVVMLTIFAAAAILVSSVEYAKTALRQRATASKFGDLRASAYSALNAAVAVLEEYSEIDGGIYSPAQGWKKPLADGRVKVPDGSDAEVEIADESGKIPLRNTDTETLVKIFEAFEISSSDAQKYADLIKDWCDADDAPATFGAEYQDYDARAALPPNRPFESLDELRYVKDVCDVFFSPEGGSPTPFFEKFAAIFSLEPFEKTNLNSASEEVLYTLMQIEQKQYRPALFEAIRGKIGAVSDGIVWCKTGEDISSRGGGDYPTTKTAFTAQYLKITVNIKRGLAQYKLIAHYADAQTYAKLRNKNTSSRTTDTAGSPGSSATSNPFGNVFENAVQNSNSAKAKKKGTFKIVRIVEIGG